MAHPFRKECLLRSVRLPICLALLPAILAIVCACGCGGDAARAKAYMEQGDAELVKMKPISLRLTKSTDQMFEQIFANGKVDTASFKKNSEAVSKAADELAAAAAVARQRYSSIDSLKEVGGYKKYGQVRIKELALNDQGLEQLKAFVDAWNKAISESAFDPVAFVGAAKELSGQSANIATEIEKLEKQAAEVKKSEKL